MNAIGPSRIFISYSHRNPDWKDRLLRHLNVFERHHLLEVWHDETMDAGEDWERKIDQAMANARLAVVLLCPDALKSRFMLNKEFPVLERRWNGNEITVVPILCKSDCPWEAHKWLAKLQIKPRATSGPTALSQLPHDADRHLRLIATEIAEHVGRIALAELRPPSPAAGERAGVSGEVKTYLDKFPLTMASGLREEKLIGREQELALLDLAFAQPHTAIVSLVAWGGVGKTMLVQHWLRRLQREGWFGARRVYAWSFYSQGTKEDRQASEDTFLAHALEWFGVQCEPTLSPWDKGRLLADAVTRERTLLILDGIEPLQYPPGPMGGQLRAPGVQSLLKQLARRANDIEQRGLCLVTTREALTDLNDFQRREGTAWGSVLRVDLGNLTEEAGAALLHHAGAKRAGAAEIKPDDKELLAASREVDGHALTLNLLGRFLARAHVGDIRRRDLVKFEEADRKVQGGTTFKMLAAFENWFAKSGEFGARQLAVLRMLGLFDRPADAGCIAALRNPPVIAGVTDPLFTVRFDATTGKTTAQPLADEDWNTATSFLTDFGLVVIQTDADDSERLLNCHPLVRDHFAKKLRQHNLEMWRTSHWRLCNYLKDSAEHQPETIHALQPLYHAIAHGCKAGRFQDTFIELYWSRICRGDDAYSKKTLHAFGDDLTAVACFFSQPWRILADELSTNVRGWLLNEAGYSLRAIGRSEEAVQCMRAALEFVVPDKESQQAAIALGNLSQMELSLGMISSALEDARKSVYFADQSSDLHERMVRRSVLADALFQNGQRVQAMTAFATAEEMQTAEQPNYPLLYAQRGYKLNELLLHDVERSAWNVSQSLLDKDNHAVSGGTGDAFRAIVAVQARISKTLAWAIGEQFTQGIGLDYLVAGRTVFFASVLNAKSSPIRSDKFDAACEHIHTAIEALRSGNEQEFIARAILTRGWCRSLAGDIPDARADLDETWDIASRGPMRLHLADIHLYRARLFFREKHYPWKSPQDDLAAAEKLINDCGYHRRDEELADAKRAILGP